MKSQSVECSLVAYESTMLFEGCFEPNNYEDDFWFAGYCLGRTFLPDEMLEDYTQEDEDYADRELQCELISCCSYQSQFYRATRDLYHDLSI